MTKVLILVIITAALCWCIAAETKRPAHMIEGEKNRYKYPKK